MYVCICVYKTDLYFFYFYLAHTDYLRISILWMGIYTLTPLGFVASVAGFYLFCCCKCCCHCVSHCWLKNVWKICSKSLVTNHIMQLSCCKLFAVLGCFYFFYFYYFVFEISFVTGVLLQTFSTSYIITTTITPVF